MLGPSRKRLLQGHIPGIPQGGGSRGGMGRGARTVGVPLHEAQAVDGKGQPEVPRVGDVLQQKHRHREGLPHRQEGREPLLPDQGIHGGQRTGGERRGAGIPADIHGRKEGKAIQENARGFQKGDGHGTARTTEGEKGNGEKIGRLLQDIDYKKPRTINVFEAFCFYNECIIRVYY